MLGNIYRNILGPHHNKIRLNSKTWIKVQIFIVLLTKETANQDQRAPACPLSWVLGAANPGIVSLTHSNIPHVYLMWPRHNRCNQLGDQQSYQTDRRASLQLVASYQKSLWRPIHLVPSHRMKFLATYCIIMRNIMLIVNSKLSSHFDRNVMARKSTCQVSASCKIPACHLSNWKQIKTLVLLFSN